MKTTFHVALTFGIAIVAFLFGQMYQPSGAQDMFGISPKERDATSRSDFALTRDQVKEAVELANRGSQEVARKLYFYYSFHESNDSEAIDWQLALADMGDTFSQQASMKEYFTARVANKREEGIERCTAWLEKPKTEPQPVLKQRSPAKCGASSLAANRLLLQHGLDHLHDESVLGFGEAGGAFEPFEPFSQLRWRPALAAAAYGLSTLTPTTGVTTVQDVYVPPIIQEAPASIATRRKGRSRLRAIGRHSRMSGPATASTTWVE